ncbi:MAG: hypothetical protein A2X13_11270 [Bacteroidetes bacterium GWC2_33_15]|nr:MAG: hypothetical protein A2X10_13460 [Bacteroidetes bacterium GWA2_33_15]OFX49246.1 MAG: hypothetical protein A2X13_11270 [Bacteroidetes bacterium GWC2_33_15]OFX65412.1 MAG: hypothetical protein A2X15_00345 [Bacteroidetes bacterium GWB2_32_14]OFX69590.1 MAG: hypothetical protein A2X14_00925 [Bacteroidetes bacterium GWD2_33_33]HAN17498.1 hypothetical protein [Bacteroidales bacterium]
MPHPQPLPLIFTKHSGDNIHSDKSSEIILGGSYFYNYNKLITEIIIGGGFGNLEYRHEIDLESDYEFDLNAQKYNLFVQPNIGLRFNDHVELALSTRFLQQNYYNISSNLTLGELSEVSNADRYFINKNMASLYFIEPGLTFRAGGERFKVQTQIIPVFYLNENYIRFREYSFYISLFIDLKTNN